jgi:hypothetical protein
MPNDAQPSEGAGVPGWGAFMLMDLRATFMPMDDGSVAVLQETKWEKLWYVPRFEYGASGGGDWAYLKSKLLASKLIAEQIPDTTHGGRIVSFISML